MKNLRFTSVYVLLLALMIGALNLNAQTAPEGFILVEGGKFVMGSNEEEREQPIHEVYVDSFLIGKYEVTQSEYVKILKNNPSMYKGDNRPVNNISWYQAIKYCNQRSKMEGLKPCYSGTGKDTKCDFSANGYRLPTEAEWEFAAKGGLKGKGYVWAGSDNPDEVAVYNKKLHTGPQVPGTKKPNELGIFDMNGNVRELCWDWFGPYKGIAQNNPSGPENGEFRVERGGSWKHDEYFCRNTNRWFHDPIFNYGSVGFRLVRTIEKQKAQQE
ncbi:MAG: SUMF1/EgtB/PvdO family nonheme iron enzyme [Candidatus Marinimicrobia bacterium]|nr:SUMF1/EgtB/PvdO family nonheme iron enzyme [Candidatus Neomarinimicrobiota bacterium]